MSFGPHFSPLLWADSSASDLGSLASAYISCSEIVIAEFYGLGLVSVTRVMNFCLQNCSCMGSQENCRLLVMPMASTGSEEEASFLKDCSPFSVAVPEYHKPGN
jgi:hypothetical protein